MVTSLAHLGVEALNAARRWALSRVTLRRIMDSKTASPAQNEKAKRDYQKCTNDLEQIMLQLESHLAENGSRISAAAKKQGGGKPFPWKSFLGMVAEGARALETAVAHPPGGVAGPSDDFIRAEVIDSKPGKK